MFIIHHHIDYYTANKITLTRARAGHSNCGASVEQKDWTHMLEFVGYRRRYTSAALFVPNQIRDLNRTFTNYLLPQQKLVLKQRNSAKVTKRDVIASIPHRRAIGRDDIQKHPIIQRNAQFKKLKPAALLLQVLTLTGRV